MKNNYIGGLIFAIFGLILLVLRHQHLNYFHASLLGIGAVYLLYKIKQRRKATTSRRGYNISIIICSIGLILLSVNNSYGVSVICLALLSDLLWPLIIKSPDEK